VGRTSSPPRPRPRCPPDGPASACARIGGIASRSAGPTWSRRKVPMIRSSGFPDRGPASVAVEDEPSVDRVRAPRHRLDDLPVDVVAPLLVKTWSPSPGDHHSVRLPARRRAAPPRLREAGAEVFQLQRGSVASAAASMSPLSLPAASGPGRQDLLAVREVADQPPQRQRQPPISVGRAMICAPWRGRLLVEIDDLEVVVPFSFSRRWP